MLASWTSSRCNMSRDVSPIGSATWPIACESANAMHAGGGAANDQVAGDTWNCALERLAGCAMSRIHSACIYTIGGAFLCKRIGSLPGGPMCAAPEPQSLPDARPSSSTSPDSIDLPDVRIAFGEPATPIFRCPTC